MPSRINIDNETRKMIKAYNDKVYRLRKKGVEMDYLRLSDFAGLDPIQRDLTLRYTTAFRRRGSERTTESGVKGYELDYAKILLERVNEQRAARLRKMGDISPYKGNLGVVARSNLLPRELIFSTPQEFQKALISLETELKPDFYLKTDTDYKESYFKAAHDNLGESAEKRLRQLLKDVPPDEFYFMSSGSPELHIDYEYVSDSNDINYRVDFIESRWKEELENRGIV